MLNRFRAFWTRLIQPIAAMLLRAGVSPDAVTFVGTAGVSAGALVFFPIGQLWIGVVVITLFVFSDLIDGLMARASGRSTVWGAFLDSTLDRIGDAAIFGGLLLYYAGPGDALWMVWICLVVLAMGATTSYARARAESLGMQAKGGLAERSDRLVPTLVVAFFSDVWNLPVLLQIVLCWLALASTITVGQRMWRVHRQARSVPAPTTETRPDDAGTEDAGTDGADGADGAARGTTCDTATTAGGAEGAGAAEHENSDSER